MRIYKRNKYLDQLKNKKKINNKIQLTWVRIPMKNKKFNKLKSKRFKTW